MDGRAGKSRSGRSQARDILWNCTSAIPIPRRLFRIVERVRGIFDLGADPAELRGPSEARCAA